MKLKSIKGVVSAVAALSLVGCAPEGGFSGNPEDLAQAESVSRQELSERLSRAGRSVDVKVDLETKHRELDENAITHTRFRQTYKGVRVFGGEAIVHLKADGTVFAVTDDLIPNIDVDVRAQLSPAQAADLAAREHGCSTCLTAAPETELVILRQDGKDSLAYRVQLRQEDNTADTTMPVYFMDAVTGEKLWKYENLQTASATGTGYSLYSGTQSITTYYNGSAYYLEDTGRKLGTFDNRNTTTSVYRFSDTDNVWGNGSTSSSQSAAVDAHFGAAKTYDYYLNVHGRRGIDGAGGPAYYTSIDGVTGLVSSKVHYSSGYNNAFWNGSLMTYGDGDGTTFKSLVALDICGHEMTHGVTERTANLTYSNESGALNESMSDVFGAMVERYAKGESANTWKIGEDSYTPATAGDALRYMDNPHAKAGGTYTADDDPDHYAERYLGTADSGGVHINSGIANKAFFLVAKGGTHHRSGITVTGIGADAAAKIWYKALTSYMTASTNFAGARTATLNAAAALYGSGSANYNAVAQAWSAVGVP